MSKPRAGVLYSRVRVEEKLLFEAFEARGVSLDLLDDLRAKNEANPNFEIAWTVSEELVVLSDDEYKLKAVQDIIKGKCVKRGVSLGW